MSRLFAVTCRDAPGTADARAATRAAHDAHVDRLGDVMALGAALGDERGVAVGSLMILRVADEAAVRAILAVDPFLVAGVWESFEIRTLTPRVGAWVGGRQ